MLQLRHSWRMKPQCSTSMCSSHLCNGMNSPWPSRLYGGSTNSGSICLRINTYKPHIIFGHHLLQKQNSTVCFVFVGYRNFMLHYKCCFCQYFYMGTLCAVWHQTTSELGIANWCRYMEHPCSDLKCYDPEVCSANPASANKKQLLLFLNGNKSVKHDKSPVNIWQFGYN